MPGVTDTNVYSGPEGTVRKAQGSSGTTYHAVRQTVNGPKGRYYDTLRGAKNWLIKNHKTKA